MHNIYQGFKCKVSAAPIRTILHAAKIVHLKSGIALHVNKQTENVMIRKNDKCRLK